MKNITEEVIKSTVAGSVGTTFMTLFSSAVSEKVQTQFKEHEILADMLSVSPFRKGHHTTLGWLGHFGAGIGFTYLNRIIQEKRHLKPGLMNGIGFGLLDVLAGIAVWKSIFVLHKSPPPIHLRKYFMHLILAHMIFGALSNISLNLMDKYTKRA